MSRNLRPALDEHGKHIAFAWPGGYPVLHYTRGGDMLCAACADKLAADPDTLEGEKATMSDVYYEGPPEMCAECGEETESAYGDPEAEGEVSR